MKRNRGSLESAGCSMVVAVTQDSVNSTLKEYLDHFDGDFINRAYCVDVDENNRVIYKPVDYEEVKRAVGMDLYGIPQEKDKRTKEQEEAIHKAYDEQGFTLGFRFRIGLPEAQNVTALRDIVTFLESDNTSIANVLYTMYLKEFEIIKIAVVPQKGYIFTTLTQNPDNPWYFTSRVKLNMKGGQFDSLPTEIKDKLKPKDCQGNLNMDQLLSIQQLYMDLNTAKLTDEFELKDFSGDKEIYNLLKSGFLDGYVQECRKKGDMILGYFAKQFNPSDEQEFIWLRDFNFCITPYYKEDGSVDNKNQGMYALNYLFSVPGQELGDIKRYANAVRWNWVDQAEAGTIHGRMAVDRSGLLDQFVAHFTKSLKNLQMKPCAEINVNLVKVKSKIWMEPDSAMPVFTYDDGRYKYSYKKSAEAHETYLNKGKIALQYEVTSTISFANRRISFETSILCDANLTINGSKAGGRLYNSTLFYGVELAVNQNGKLVVNPDKEVTEKKGNDSVKSETWIAIQTMGLAKKGMNSLKEYIQKGIDTYKEQAILDMKGAFSDMNYWVFPGGRVFAFRDPEFNMEGNTMVGITYVEPKNKDD